jgi:hypothetical protein
MYKHYGGVERFKGRSSFLFVKCLENAIKKENELPKLINEIVKEISNKDTFVPQFDKPVKKMRSAEEILKDYGLGGVNNG